MYNENQPKGAILGYFRKTLKRVPAGFKNVGMAGMSFHDESDVRLSMSAAILEGHTRHSCFKLIRFPFFISCIFRTARP
ncbi:MAG: hypothetical protein CVU89_15230 [Firmicutes bacterium HGW-Firmicutes-14]|nr:MAG: hypothetical protein CVU89_15230 [Firmicutes bacterium HGW-Firmicutes-14]